MDKLRLFHKLNEVAFARGNWRNWAEKMRGGKRGYFRQKPAGFRVLEAGHAGKGS